MRTGLTQNRFYGSQMAQNRVSVPVPVPLCTLHNMKKFDLCTLQIMKCVVCVGKLQEEDHILMQMFRGLVTKVLTRTTYVHRGDCQCFLKRYLTNCSKCTKNSKAYRKTVIFSAILSRKIQNRPFSEPNRNRRAGAGSLEPEPDHVRTG